MERSKDYRSRNRRRVSVFLEGIGDGGATEIAISKSLNISLRLVRQALDGLRNDGLVRKVKKEDGLVIWRVL